MQLEERRIRLAELCRIEATRVQAWFRMCWHKAYYFTLRPRIIHAVIAVQANFHRRPVQQRYRQMRAAAMHLQGFARFVRSTRILRILKERRERWCLRRKEAVTKITACWRGYVCRQSASLINPVKPTASYCAEMLKLTSLANRQGSRRSTLFEGPRLSRFKRRSGVCRPFCFVKLD